VSAIYEDPSLKANLTIVLLRLIFYKDETQGHIYEGNAKKSLEAVNRWGETLHRLSAPHLKHDLSVWLTRLDLGGPSGYAPVSGICDPTRSCTLNRDEGLTSAFIIAHEMGHVFLQDSLKTREDSFKLFDLRRFIIQVPLLTPRQELVLHRTWWFLGFGASWVLVLHRSWCFILAGASY
ncbi:A disintegrin and metalloproteinase with thrombospondin motifs 3, partial [Armadillidium nasatum]